MNVVYVQCEDPYPSRSDLLNIQETSAFNLTNEKNKMIKSTLTLLILLIVTLSTNALAEEFSADVISQLPAGKSTGKLYFKNGDIEMKNLVNRIFWRRFV